MNRQRSGSVLVGGKRVLQIEARAIDDLTTRLDERFSDAVHLLYRCEGKVVVSGMGKSGLVGQKIAATLASTGTPAFFLHPAEVYSFQSSVFSLQYRELPTADS